MAILIAGTVLRTLWLRADPPTDASGSVGIVWHDEGAWVHNARNRALWGVWRTDAWNPVFIAPVFTGLEYTAFRAFGVGTWQARTVPAVSGLVALVCLMAGLRATGGRGAALVGGALLATNSVFVMGNRAALMESTMTAGIVASWAAYALAERRGLWGLFAGLAAVLAWFTKASAASFVAALVVEASTTIWLARRRTGQTGSGAAWTLGGLVLMGLAVTALFVLPHWSEYRFYNWQMSVTRKPSYALHDLLVRASWLPIVSDFFTRMWLVVVAGAIAIIGIVSGWRLARPADRLLVLWVLIGLAELVVHNSGEERYYVMLIPALIALTATWLTGRDPDRAESQVSGARTIWVTLPLIAFLGYLALGSLVRLGFPEAIAAGNFHRAVWLSTALAVLLSLFVVLRRPSATAWLSRWRLSPPTAALFLLIAVAWNLGEYATWAHVRQDTNYRASVEVGRLLPPGTLVHGKLANGLSLENAIRPVFIGHGFGNYDDRLRRDDVRYILTYKLPRVGYESQDRSGLIQEILDHYPNRRVVATFDVDETGGADRAMLVDKVPDGASVVTPHARH
jgi:4-amino-4-deoxy-L-arabinose transferase-like glycosyltransferase